MTVRRPYKSDYPDVEKLSKLYKAPMPEFWERAAIVENDKHEVVAFGYLRHNVEAVFMANGSKREKAEALIKLMQVAIKDAELLRFNDIYIFAQNKEFAKILSKHFEFKNIETIPMILEF